MEKMKMKKVTAAAVMVCLLASLSLMGSQSGAGEIRPSVNERLVDFNPQRDYASAIFRPASTAGIAQIRITNLRSTQMSTGWVGGGQSSIIYLPDFQNTAWSGRTVFLIECFDEAGLSILRATFDTGDTWVRLRNAYTVGVTFR
jgi:hypothetical protein